jgi:anti-sigma factor RsiW
MMQPYHLTAERLEGYVEGLLDQAERAVVESHLAGCAGCRQEVDEWLALFAALSDLPELEPAPDFADRVMSRVRIAPRAQLQQWQRLVAGAGAAVSRFLPKTTFGWAVSVAFLSLPMLAVAAAVAWLLRNPYVEPATLWTFVAGRALDGVRVLGSSAAAAAMQTDVAAWTVARVTALLGGTGPTVLAAAAGATAFMTMLSIWVLYRNLVRTPSRDSRYALFSL